MNEHHLDRYINEIRRSTQREIEDNLADYLIFIFEEIKRIDEAHQDLSDWVHDYQD